MACLIGISEQAASYEFGSAPLWRAPVPTMPVSHFTWQVLRAVKRSKKPPTGKQLRLAPTRRTKDGTFLDDLVRDGLLGVASVDEATADTHRWPAQFRTRYKLTTNGEFAAEYGEYEREVRPREGESV